VSSVTSRDCDRAHGVEGDIRIGERTGRRQSLRGGSVECAIGGALASSTMNGVGTRGKESLVSLSRRAFTPLPTLQVERPRGSGREAVEV
jgi:hypothetical protein